jgi:trk system potassium uptake protein TrkA
MKRFIVIGLGNFGASVAEALHAQGHEVVAVDQNEASVDRIAPHVTRAAVGDGKSVAILDRLGARKADVGIVSTGDDITSSILATVALRDLEVRDIYVKVISRDHARVMDRIGVTDTIFPERDTALALAQRLASAALLNFVRLGPGFSLQEMAVGDQWAGKTLRQLRLRQRFRINVVALHDVLTDKIDAAPDPDVVLKDSDTLIVAGKDEDLSRAADATE